jgi:hypothetical protein
MVNDFDNAEETYTVDNGAGRLPTGGITVLVGMAIASGLAFLGGMLIGKKKGEARGLAIGLELGRTEATAALVAPRPWQRLWRREAAA